MLIGGGYEKETRSSTFFGVTELPLLPRSLEDRRRGGVIMKVLGSSSSPLMIGCQLGDCTCKSMQGCVASEDGDLGFVDFVPDWAEKIGRVDLVPHQAQTRTRQASYSPATRLKVGLGESRPDARPAMPLPRTRSAVRRTAQPSSRVVLLLGGPRSLFRDAKHGGVVLRSPDLINGSSSLAPQKAEGRRRSIRGAILQVGGPFPRTRVQAFARH